MLEARVQVAVGALPLLVAALAMQGRIVKKVLLNDRVSREHGQPVAPLPAHPAPLEPTRI